MNEKNFKKAIYIVLFILIMLFFTKDINIFGDKFYKNIKDIDDPSNILVLVNKNNKLSSTYIPDDLEEISIIYSNKDKYLRSFVKDAFETLSNDASRLGYKIIAVSAFRDYGYQDGLYQKYVEEKGSQYADMCSARPGHSEHQTGLAVDVMGSNLDYGLFEESDEFDWMKNNAYKYGFVLRYPKDKSKITGFKYEPWHYRYVGVDVASYIYENDITLEEYLTSK